MMNKFALLSQPDMNAKISDPVFKRLALGSIIGMPASLLGYVAAKKLGRSVVGNRTFKLLGEHVPLHELFGRIGAGVGLSGGMLASNKILNMADAKKKGK